MSADPSFYAGFVTPGAAHCFPGGCMTAPTVRGRFAMNHGYAQGRQLLATDPLGTTTLTLTNVVAGSRYRIERQGDGSLATPEAAAVGLIPAALTFDDATVRYDGTQAGETAVASYDGRYVLDIELDYYRQGSDFNSLEVKVRKATSAPNYRPWNTLLTVSAAAVSTYVDQQPDD